MKKSIATLLIIAMTSPSLARADDANQPATPPAAVTKTSLSPEDPGVISPIAKGQPAPFPGVLFSPRAAASVVTDVSTIKDKIKIEVDAAVHAAESKKDFDYNELKARCLSDKTRADADKEYNQKQIVELQGKLKDAESAAPSRPLWFGLGVAGGIAVTVLAAFAITQATK
jgi:hypothetical protein